MTGRHTGIFFYSRVRPLRENARQNWCDLLSTDDGSQYGSYEDARTENAQRVPASDGIPNIGDDPTHVGQRRTPKETSEKSRHEERADVLRARLADIEDGVSAKGEKRNILPPKQLGPGSPQRGAGHVA